jgi:hypothetical protein
MTPVWISQLHNQDRLTGTLANLQRGPNPARIEFYTAPRPVGGGAATTLLATVTLDDPAGEVVGDYLVLFDPADALVLVDGTPAWARVKDGNGAASMDVDVSDLAGDGHIKLEFTNLLAGGAIRIVVAQFG